MSKNDDRDELYQWLAEPIDCARSSTALRDSVIHQSVGVLRRRRKAKRIGLAAALVGCYLGGMMTMSLLRSNDAAENISIAAAPQTSGTVGGPECASTPATQQRKAALATTKLTPYDRLRRLGDRQLADETDIPGAIRTYRKALQVASADELALSLDNDTWLLMAMKTDQSNP